MRAVRVSPEEHRRNRQIVDPYKLGRRNHGHGRDGGAHGEPTGHGEGGPADKRVIVGYGFWIFLLSDIVMFSAFFAAHAVLARAAAGRPSGPQLFEPSRLALETACLLASSFTCGLSGVAAEARSQLWSQVSLLITGLLGLAFLALEVQEFAEMLAREAGPQQSAFLSSFFAVVGCHGVHVAAGLLWLGTMMAQIFVKGFRPNILRRLLCFSLFWHALDIIWVALFTIVYLMGAGR
ncbi:cytochrome c oxidase subunit 3 [Roseomonas chloroacetimidivorans]|uniref:cytochrome c oxidase subunit 3 n=1 Tax=Roseomonas chloroacetimidivorans TaxID=1766656 RepID=UPI003C7615FC